MNLDAEEHLAGAKPATTQTGGGQGDMTVMEMDERIHLIIGDVSVGCNGGVSPRQHLSLGAAVRV